VILTAGQAALVVAVGAETAERRGVVVGPHASVFDMCAQQVEY